ncbi:MAG TPA: hypothetical protein ENH46_03510 [Candidatus Pacearchaeota archaeon]|nr:hypothetical protein [Candidatus Pacearchaeota archaeon]
MKKIKLIVSPLNHKILFQTPAGIMNEREYLVWLENQLLEIRESIKNQNKSESQIKIKQKELLKEIETINIVSGK